MVGPFLGELFTCTRAVFKKYLPVFGVIYECKIKIWILFSLEESKCFWKTLDVSFVSDLKFNYTYFNITVEVKANLVSQYNKYFIPMTFNTPLKVCFSNKKNLITIQTRPTQIVKLFFSYWKTVFLRIFKDY